MRDDAGMPEPELPSDDGSDDGSGAGWVADRLSASTARVAVGSVVPSGYPAAVRVLHPASDEDGEPARWADVAAATGRRVHPLVQWDAVSTVVRGARTRPGWDGEEPDPGNLDPAPLAALVGVLAEHTGTPQDCRFCLWEGWGEVRGPAGAAAGPPVRVGGREHVLLPGPLAAALELGQQVSPTLFVPRSPNLFWPADRAWCAATEVDLDSTLVAGSAELVDAVLAHPDLEAWPVGLEDSLAPDGDRINVPAP